MTYAALNDMVDTLKWMDWTTIWYEARRRREGGEKERGREAER